MMFTKTLTRRPKLALSLLVSALALTTLAILSLDDVSAKTTTEKLGGSQRYLTYLTTDKPIYRVGEPVYLRGVVLAAHDRTPNDSAAYGKLEILDPAGANVYTSQSYLQHSVMGFAWRVPEGQAGGEYTAKITYPQTGWAPAQRKFDIRSYRNARITSQMEFMKKAYGPGEKVYASLQAKRAEGGIPKDAPVTAVARIDGKEVWRGSTKLNDKGECAVSFNLPKEIAVGEGNLAFVIEDGGVVESVAKTLPILLRKLDVHAYPEGGDLVAGLKSRVYFQAMTPWGDPADFEGKIVDVTGKNKVVARVKSRHEGRGRTEFTPKAGHSYQLVLNKPAGIVVPVDLPEVKESGSVITNTAQSYDADAPIEFTMASTHDQKIRVVASNYEKEIAAMTLPVKAGEARNVMLTPPGSAEGVIRITLYDEENTPLAERLVFRKPRRQLTFEVTANRESFTPRDAVELTITARDPEGDVVEGAVIGLNVTDESVLEMIETRKQTARLPGLVYLESNVEKLEDARLYLSDKPEASIALDLLLGTQGWRRFAFDNIEKFKADHGDAALRVLAFKKHIQPVNFGGIGGGRGGAWGERKAGRDGAPEREKLADDEDNAEAPMENGPKQEGKNDDQKAGAPPPAQGPKLPANDPVAPADKNAQKDERKEVAKRVAAKREEVLDEIGELRRIRADRRAPNRNPRVRVFRVYAHKVDAKTASRTRSDFTETVFWSAGLVTDKNGQVKVSFNLSDTITSFKVMADGFSRSGLMGTADMLIESRKPFFVEPKLPLEVTAGDIVLAPVVYANNTKTAFEATHSATLGEGLSLDWGWDGAERARAESITVAAGTRVRDLLPIRVGDANGPISVALASKGGNYTDDQARSIKVVPRGFPIAFDKGGMLEADGTLTFEVNILEGVIASSIKTEAKVYPTPLANLQEAVASLIRQPYGCFEQTSSVVYPMVMAQQYLMTHEGSDVALIAKAKDFIDKGYKKLKGFECKDGGYEWFGRGPGHEALTAYGVVEFADIAKVQGIDNEMLARTQKWLADRKDGKGGFKRNKKALDSFGGAPTDITNAYIVWSLTREATNHSMLKEEIAALKEAVKTSKDTYFRGLVCGVLYNIGEKDAADVLAKELADAQQEDGSVSGAKTSITRSRGNSLLIETTSIAILNWLENDDAYAEYTEKAIRWLSERCQNGRFGSTQGTVLALKAILAYDDARAHPKAAGEVIVSIDGVKVATQAFDTETKGTIDLGDFAANLLPGNHSVTLQMAKGSKMPYSMHVEYFAETPASSTKCPLWIETKLSDDEVKEGAVTEVQVTLSNNTKEGLATTMALVGIPGGLEVRHDKLKELVEAGTIAFYEVLGRDVALYFREFAPEGEVKISLDCVAAVPGEYTGPASRAYLYYGDEHKHWTRGLFVKINGK